MTDAQTHDVLNAECRTFTRYLAGVDAPPDVLAAYRKAHQVSGLGRWKGPVDDLLITIARRGIWCARAADGYASLFARASFLRQKLILLVAILESRGETARILDTARPGSRAGWMLRVIGQAWASIVRLGLVALMIALLRIWRGLTR